MIGLYLLVAILTLIFTLLCEKRYEGFVTVGKLVLFIAISLIPVVNLLMLVVAGWMLFTSFVSLDQKVF